MLPTLVLALLFSIPEGLERNSTIREGNNLHAEQLQEHRL